MAKVIIDVPRYKGEYDLDPEVPMTALDWSWIKKVSGYMPNDVMEGFEGNDPALYVALAVVALHRADKITAREAPLVGNFLMTCEFGSITVDFGDDDEAELADEPRAEGEAPSATNSP